MAAIAMLALACNSAASNKKSARISDVQLEKIKSEDQIAKSASADTTAIGVINDEPEKFKAPPPIKTIIDWDKKIIKTADIKLELKDYGNYNKTIHSNLKIYGAYIAKEEQSQLDGLLQNTVTIKVPVDRFDDLVNSFNGDGITVIEKKINTEDVTADYIDGKARLEAKKQVREQYLQLLKQAKNMKDVLTVQQEINNIQEEIESVNGRINYLSHQAAYSTINLNYYQYLFGKNPLNNHPTFITKIYDAFKDGFSLIGNLSIFIVTIWPLIVAAIVVVLIIKKKKWRTQKQVS